MTSKCHPHFSLRGFDFENDLLDPTISMLACAFSHNESYGLAHMRFLCRQKYNGNLLNFNTFVFNLLDRNTNRIFVAGFSLIFDNVFFLIFAKTLIFYDFLHVTILSCFAN